MENVMLVPYERGWQNAFQKEETVIREVINDAIVALEHVGSTSIEGMPAKPIIDIAITVAHFDNIVKITEALALKGYTYVPKSYDDTRRFFRKGAWGAGTCHIHLFINEHEDFTNMLLFRDYIRSHPKAYEEYAKLKCTLKDQYERQTYTKMKAPFIQKTIQRAKKEMSR